MIRLTGLIAVAILLTNDALAQMKLPTLDEAQTISSQTGRPIFAMAGQET